MIVMYLFNYIYDARLIVVFIRLVTNELLTLIIKCTCM
jgi:hypothetical protein